MAAVMLCLRKHLQKPDRPSSAPHLFFPPPASLLLHFLMPSVFSFFSHRHHRSPATSPTLLLVATSLSTSAVHPSSPFSLSSRSCCRPTATTLPPPLSLSSLHPLHIRPLSLHLGIADCRRLLSLTSTVGFFLRRDRYRCRLLSLSSLLLFLRLPDVLLCVISASARISMASKLVALNPSTSAPPFLPSSRRRPRPLPLSSMPPPWPPSPRPPLLLPRPRTVAAFLPPPLMSSPPPYFSIAALPPHQGPKRVLVRHRHRPFSSPPPSATTAVDSSRRWASARGRRWCSLILFSFWDGNGLKLYLVGWVGLAYWAKYGLGWPVG